MAEKPLSRFLNERLVCPRDRMPLIQAASFLQCPAGHDYPIVDGIPVLLLDDEEQTIPIASSSIKMAREVAEGRISDDPLFTSTLGLSDDERQGVLSQLRGTNLIDPV